MFLCRKSLVAPLVFFLRPVLCFRGARRSSMMLSCVLATSRKICALFLALGSFWALSGGFFRVFFESWTNLLVFERLAVLVFYIVDPQGHVFVPAGAARPPTRRQMGSQSRFPPPLGVAFRTTFSYFSYFSEFCDFVKIELPCRRELGFEGPGRSKCHFFSLGTPSKNRSEFGGS